MGYPKQEANNESATMKNTVIYCTYGKVPKQVKVTRIDDFTGEFTYMQHSNFYNAKLGAGFFKTEQEAIAYLSRKRQDRLAELEEAVEGAQLDLARFLAGESD